MHPAGTFQAFPERGGMMKDSFCTSESFGSAARRLYNSVGGWRGESAEVGKYAGAGGVSLLGGIVVD